jgi:hypothetical protein
MQQGKVLTLTNKVAQRAFAGYEHGIDASLLFKSAHPAH